MAQHKWHKEIKAWADGAEIETKMTNGNWVSCYPQWFDEDEYRIKPQQKCIVKGCENHTHEGKFVGDLCAPCWDYITNGKGVHSQAYRNAQPKEPQYLYVFRTSTNGQTEYKLWDDKDTGGAYIGKIKLEVDDETA